MTSPQTAQETGVPRLILEPKTCKGGRPKVDGLPTLSRDPWRTGEVTG